MSTKVECQVVVVAEVNLTLNMRLQKIAVLDRGYVVEDGDGDATLPKGHYTFYYRTAIDNGMGGTQFFTDWSETALSPLNDICKFWRQC